MVLVDGNGNVGYDVYGAAGHLWRRSSRGPGDSRDRDRHHSRCAEEFSLREIRSLASQSSTWPTNEPVWHLGPAMRCKQKVRSLRPISTHARHLISTNSSTMGCADSMTEETTTQVRSRGFMLLRISLRVWVQISECRTLPSQERASARRDARPCLIRNSKKCGPAVSQPTALHTLPAMR